MPRMCLASGYVIDSRSGLMILDSDYGTLKEELPTVGSSPSLYSHGSTERLARERAREDLYQWMAKQEPIKMVQYSDRGFLFNYFFLDIFLTENYFL